LIEQSINSLPNCLLTKETYKERKRKMKIISIALLKVALATTAHSTITETPSTTPVRPIDILPDRQDSQVAEDGTVVRKGTIKSTIDNIQVLNNIFKLPAGQERQQKLQSVLHVMDELMKPLYHVGAFSFFTPLEWLQDSNNQGRILIALVFLQKFPAEVTAQIKQRLKVLLPQCSPEVQQRITDILAA
jgi:hypothetical protein